MPDTLSSNVWKILVCPFCRRALDRISSGASCKVCDVEYGYSKSGSLDLRLKMPKTYHLEFEIESPLLPESGFDFNRLSSNPDPEVDFSGVSLPHHLTKALMSYFPKARTKESLVLDLGCGDTIHKEICEHCGFKYVGLDYDSPHAPILGDAQSLPFGDNSFDFVLSIAVLEHIRFPFVMMREVCRVLKPLGKYIGTVAFLEPFHGDSFYHHTHLGTFNSLRYGGFRVDRIAPSDKWSVLVAQAKMGLFPRMPVTFSKALVFPLLLLHKFWWRVTRSRKAYSRKRILKTSGDFSYVATKPESR